MSQQEEVLNGKATLSVKQQAVLDLLLKGELSDKLKVEKIPARTVHSPVPLSFSQQRLWILDQLVPGNAFYNLPTAIQLQGEIDIPVFERSLNEMVRRHESMRTVFAVDGETEEPVQIILPELELKVDVIDLRGLPESEQRTRTGDLMALEASKPFNLKEGPLVRVTLVKLDNDIYCLFHTMHHIVSDTWSMEIFNKEIITIYSAFSRGEPSPLPDPVLQYADFAVWQRGWLKGDVLEKQLSYWRELLSGELPILELPADRQRPAVSTYRGKIHFVQISESLTAELAELNRKERCSMFMSLLAIFNLLLYRYSGQDEVMVGSPIANRNRAEVEDMIGFFANTLVFRTDLSGKPSFRELLARVRKVTSGAYDNQDLPFEKLVEEFQPDRYMSHTPFFQVMFVLQNIPKQEARPENAETGAETGADTGADTGENAGENAGGRGVSMNELPIHTGASKFDMWLSLGENQSGVEGVIEYSTDIFEHDTIKRFVTHFYNLIAGVIENPDCPIDELSILSGEEKEEILVRWNSTGREYDIDCLHHAFREQAARTPEAPALVFEETELTYEQLNRKADGLARFLREKGVQPDVPVGVSLERSIEMVAALMGILKAGGAYLPLDPEYPKERLAYMMADAGMRILLTTRELYEGSDKLESWGAETVFLEEFFPGPGAGPGREAGDHGYPGVEMSVSNLAYIIYTSGSTGKPKGVMVPHQGISNRLHWMQEAFGLTDRDRVLQKTPFSFDVSVWEFFWPLLTGAVLVLARPGGHKDSEYLARVIREKGITTIHFVPTMLNAFLETPGLRELESLKRVICSGEALPAEYRDRFFERMSPGTELHNLYGPTEASVDVTSWACEREGARHVVPIGRPIANTQVYILDRNSKPVPVGVHGELHIGGIQLARGYVNRPGLTAETFNRTNKSYRSYKTNIPLYKTGDLCRWLPDGTVEFIDRLDFQVKVRGFRIELGEIESNLREHGSLLDAVVLAREDAPGSKSKKLAAYVVPDSRYLQVAGGGESPDDNIFSQQVDDWENVFDDAYARDPGEEDPTFNIAGWNSSYTGDPLPAGEMRTWVDNTVRRILSLEPRDVLEIGCGTGLFLFPIIPFCRRFVGTDIAQEGLNYIQQKLELLKKENRAAKSWAEVELRHSSADNFKGIPQNYLSLVILNSVVQYFPSVDYLVEVLENAVSRVKPGGYIFLGDIRSLPLLKTFHASVEFHKAEPGETRDSILRRAVNRMNMEQELIVHPRFFMALKHRFPRIERVELLHKYGRYSNELSKFRYDVILHIGSGIPGENAQINKTAGIQPVIADWKEENLTLAEVRRRLAETGPRVFKITGVPNGRVVTDARVLKWLTGTGESAVAGEMRESLTGSNGDETAFYPDDFLELKDQLPYRISVVLSDPDTGDAAGFDVVFIHRDISPEAVGGVGFPAPDGEFEPQPWNFYTNNPLLVKASAQLVPELRGFLRGRLPEYMVPSNFVLLDRLPLSPNGKLDRKVLPEPIQALQGADKEFIAPVTPLEKFFARIWSDVLNLEKVGINYNFFELGGDSINAIQVISRANKEGYQLNVQLLYQNQCIRDLAKAVEGVLSAEKGKELDFHWDIDRATIEELLPPGVEIEQMYPTTPMQRHQLFYLGNRDIPDPPVFLFQRSTMVFQAELDIPLLEQALQKAIDVYPLLRTFIISEGLEEPVQVVAETGSFDFTYCDLSGYSPRRQVKKYLKMMQVDWRRGFRRDRSMPMRATLVKMGEDRWAHFFLGDYTRIDGWSANVIIDDIFDYFYALAAGVEPRMPGNPNDCYPEYLHLLRQKDEAEEAKDYWCSVYKDYVPPKSITAVPGNKTGKGKGFGKEYHYFSARTSNRLERLLMEKQLSLSIFIQGIWAMTLCRYTEQDKMVYGLLTTGRSIAIAGIEYMGGHSINILPVHLQIDPRESMPDYLKRVWDIQTEWSRYDWTRLERIYEWCELPPDQWLFESIFVMQNLDSAKGNLRGMEQDADGWVRMSHQFFAKMEYPVRLDIFTGVEYCLILDYYRRYFVPPVMKGILDNMNTLVEAFVHNPDQSVGELMALIDPERYKVHKKAAPTKFSLVMD